MIFSHLSVFGERGKRLRKLQKFPVCVVGALVDEGWSLSRTLLYSTAPVHRGPHCPHIDSAWLSDVTTGLRNVPLILISVLPLTFLFQLGESLETSLCHAPSLSKVEHHLH